ncbi:MAG: EF-P lysine aminoacylase GenX [Methyloprofundus sp.]|nr:EF-P lysine aminoacylase GenX [Methyloprofundus sp.]MBW6452568.1 EF-P lysine aminoacylase GenX [Methyloprofundus sp.]
MSLNWQPSCSLGLIRLRAKLLHEIRDYFYVNKVLEVETPLLCQSAGTDPYLEYFTSCYSILSRDYFLQSSPEFAMKRLLAASTGSIYQITKAFRNGESGRYHNPEFTMLEWYRVGFDLQQLMDDVENLLNPLLAVEYFPDKAERIAYVDIFKKYTGLNALQFDAVEYQACAERLGFFEAARLCALDHAAWLDFLFSHVVQQYLGRTQLCMVFDYPACLPSLARLKLDDVRLVERVELFIHGIEIGNGFFELTDVNEQIRRFDQDIMDRKNNGAVKIDKDARFLAALQSGLPDCSGIAIGIDRLLMIISQKSTIDEVLAFSIENA